MKLFYDMDNTIALFSHKNNPNIALERMFEKGYFRNLPIMPNTMETLSGLQWEGHDVYILSACIDTPYCKTEKQQWLSHYLPFIPKENIILCEIGQNKAEIVGNVKNCILVDDYHKNLIEWEKAGGIPVKKRSSNKGKWQYVVKNHFDIFPIVKKLSE